MPTSEANHFWRLTSYPEGEDFSSAIAYERGPIPTPAEGEVVVRNLWLSLDAGTRMWMTPRTDSYQPPIVLGSQVPGLVLGRVVASKAPGFARGQLVRAFGQWADYSCVVPALSGLTAVDTGIEDIRQHLGVLGMNAWAAYVGITEAGRARLGETVLVSAAAGATGMLAAQMAKIMGCRVIGMAGGPDKCRFLLDKLGVDIALDYKTGDVDAKLAAAAPQGVNVYFDNVGGPLLDAVLPNMAYYGRIAVCGLVAGYSASKPIPGPMRYDQVLARRLQITGFFSPDFAHRGEEINNLLRGLMLGNRIAMYFDETTGLENVLTAYTKLFTGGNIGKVLVKLSDVP